jgi:hypothetical protein
VALDPAAVAESIRRKAVGDAAEVEPVGKGAPGDPLMILINRIPYTVMQVDRPLPRDAYESALRSVHDWPQAEQVIASCKAHLVVAPLPPIGGSHQLALQQAVDLTRLCAALSEPPESSAILWTSADIIVQPPRFRLAVNELIQKRIPVMSWIGLTPVLGPKTLKGEQTFGLLTTGLQPFVGREIEFEPAVIQPEEIAKRVLGFAYMLIVRGVFVKDGETIGLSASDFVIVRERAHGQRIPAPVFSLSMMGQT